MSKKILLIESRYNSFYGAQKSMLKLFESLEKNYDIKLLTTKNGILKKKFEESNHNVDIIELGSMANVFGDEYKNYKILGKILLGIQLLLFNIKLIVYLRKENIDVVYMNNLRTLIFCFIAPKLLGKKIVIYVRQDLRYNFVSKVGLFFANNIITIAKGVLKEFPTKWFMKNKRKVENIYTGFEFENNKLTRQECRNRIGMNTDDLIIGFVGSLTPRKGVDILIDVFERISHQHNVTLMMAGKEEAGYEHFWKEIKTIIEEKNLNVKLLGYQSDVSMIYKSMDLLVLPSKSEGLPRVVIEAMGHGVPVIATDVGGTKEIIETNKNGILISKDSVVELELAVEASISDKTFRENMGKQAEKYVKKKFSVEKFEKKVEDYFNTITSYKVY